MLMRNGSISSVSEGKIMIILHRKLRINCFSENMETSVWLMSIREDDTKKTEDLSFICVSNSAPKLVEGICAQETEGLVTTSTSVLKAVSYQEPSIQISTHKDWVSCRHRVYLVYGSELFRLHSKGNVASGWGTGGKSLKPGRDLEDRRMHTGDSLSKVEERCREVATESVAWGTEAGGGFSEDQEGASACREDGNDIIYSPIANVWLLNVTTMTGDKEKEGACMGEDKIVKSKANYT